MESIQISESGRIIAGQQYTLAMEVNSSRENVTNRAILRTSDTKAVIAPELSLTPQISSMTSTVTFKTSGNQTLTANTESDKCLVGKATLSVRVDPASASQLRVSGVPSSVMSGSSQTARVTALDQFGNIDTEFTGTVRFSSTSLSSDLPSDYTFVSSDKGSKDFSVRFGQIGTHTLTATDSSVSSINGSQANIVVQTGTPETVTIVSGNSQQGESDSNLSQPFEVVVRDLGGSPVQGVPVPWNITAPDNTAYTNPATSITNASGIATTTLHTSQLVGNHTVSTNISGVTTQASFNTSICGRDAFSRSLKTWISSSSVNGSFGSVTSADNYCKLSLPEGATSAKAVLHFPSSRSACTSASCQTSGSCEHSDWPLRKNTTYIRADNTTIGTTNALALMPASLSNSVETSSTSLWTGLESDYRASANLCTDWTSTSGTGQTGDSSSNSSTLIANSSLACNSGRKFLCVEDPETDRELQLAGNLTTTTPVISTTPIFQMVNDTIWGTSTEADGTVIVVYEDGVQMGSAVVSSNAWRANGLTLGANKAITAVADAPGKAISSSTASVTSKTSIIFDSFDGSGFLNNHAPDIRPDAGVWNAYTSGPGTIGIGGGYAWWARPTCCPNYKSFYPFSPQAGQVYTIRTSFNEYQTNTGGTAGFGFTQGNNIGIDMYDSGNGTGPWFIWTTSGANNATIQSRTTYNGGNVNHGNFAVNDSANPVILEIQLDLTNQPTDYTVTYFINQTEVRQVTITGVASFSYIGLQAGNWNLPRFYQLAVFQ